VGRRGGVTKVQKGGARGHLGKSGRSQGKDVNLGREEVTVKNTDRAPGRGAGQKNMGFLGGGAKKGDSNRGKGSNITLTHKSALGNPPNVTVGK